MTNGVKQELIDFMKTYCRRYSYKGKVSEFDCYAVTDVNRAISMFRPEATEAKTTCDCRPDYESENAKLRKELEYWKTEHQSMREKNIRLEAIVHTIEQITSKNFLG